MKTTNAAADSVLTFARSEMFARTFTDGMGLVEEVAAYLDGPGRAASRRLDRAAALAYAGESMRLTTRLMQVASWLLVQKALKEGELTLADARDEKYRFTNRPEPAPFGPHASLPGDLTILMARCDGLYERVRRLDDRIYGDEDALENAVTVQLARLQGVYAAG